MGIEENIRHFIISDLSYGGSPELLTSDYPLIENSVLDSMGIFQMVSFLEDECGIEVADEDLVPDNFATIGAIARLADSRAG